MHSSKALGEKKIQFLSQLNFKCKMLCVIFSEEGSDCSYFISTLLSKNVSL